MNTINKILIANRGEIAVRIIKTLNRMAINSVAIFDEIEQNALHVKMATESYCIGTGSLNATYLNSTKIINIAIQTGCDAIHPGYGFLSENPEFAQQCKRAGIIFIGPSENSIKLMGNKIEARKFIHKINIPITEGLSGSIEDIDDQKAKLPYPILVKAAAGGGGKGMQIVRHENDLKPALVSTSREAKNYFGNGTVYIEQYIENPRHIEVQILGDNYGNVIHLFERECSIQRRYQKIIEEAPSPTITPEVRAKICNTAVEIGKSLKYSNAGTIEFLIDENLNYYFLEMNTRIQVEHPITEMVTGIDIVEHQIKIAANKKLELKQDNISLNGHAIESRIYAENPVNNFIPSPGKIVLYKEPNNSKYRVDSSIDSACTIHDSFDPMISKLIVKAHNRKQAIKQMMNALKDYKLEGITNNITYLQAIFSDELYLKNQISTQFIKNTHSTLTNKIKNNKSSIHKTIPIAAFLMHTLMLSKKGNSIWNEIGLWRDILNIPILLDNYGIEILKLKFNDKSVDFNIDNSHYTISKIFVTENAVSFLLNNKKHSTAIVKINNQIYNINYLGYSFKLIRKDVLKEGEYYESVNTDKSLDKNKIYAPMPGKVVRIDVNEGEEIKKGANLLVIEAMKMENQIKAPINGTVKKLNVSINDSVLVSKELIEII